MVTCVYNLSTGEVDSCILLLSQPSLFVKILVSKRSCLKEEGGQQLMNTPEMTSDQKLYGPTLHTTGDSKPYLYSFSWLSLLCQSGSLPDVMTEIYSSLLYVLIKKSFDCLFTILSRHCFLAILMWIGREFSISFLLWLFFHNNNLFFKSFFSHELYYYY